MIYRTDIFYCSCKSELKWSRSRLRPKIDTDPIRSVSATLLKLAQKNKPSHVNRVSEPEPPGAGVFGWSRSRHFGPAPAPPPP